MRHWKTCLSLAALACMPLGCGGEATPPPAVEPPAATVPQEPPVEATPPKVEPEAAAPAPAPEVVETPAPAPEPAPVAVVAPTFFKFGPALCGPELKAEDLAGKVVVIDYWGVG